MEADGRECGGGKRQPDLSMKARFADSECKESHKHASTPARQHASLTNFSSLQCSFEKFLNTSRSIPLGTNISFFRQAPISRFFSRTTDVPAVAVFSCFPIEAVPRSTASLLQSPAVNKGGLGSSGTHRPGQNFVSVQGNALSMIPRSPTGVMACFPLFLSFNTS